MYAYAILLLCIATLCPSVVGNVVVMTNLSQWQAMAPGLSSLMFTDHPPFTIITNQYANAGITFTDGNDFIRATTSHSDGQGLMSIDPGGVGTIHASFDAATYSLGIEFLGGMQFELYFEGALVFASTEYSAGFTPFVGIIATMPFDAAVMHDYDDDIVSIDNLHFGTVPAPGALALLTLGVLTMLRRRRR